MILEMPFIHAEKTTGSLLGIQSNNAATTKQINFRLIRIKTSFGVERKMKRYYHYRPFRHSYKSSHLSWVQMEQDSTQRYRVQLSNSDFSESKFGTFVSVSPPHPICCPSKYCYSSSMSHYDTCFYSDSSHTSTSTLTEQEAEKGSWFFVGFGDLQCLEGRLMSLLREGLTTSKAALTKMCLLGNRKWENYEAIMSTDNKSMGMQTCSLQLHVTLTTVCLWGTINAISPWLNM